MATKKTPQRDQRMNRNRLFLVDPSLHVGVRVEDLRVTPAEQVTAQDEQGAEPRDEPDRS